MQDIAAEPRNKFQALCSTKHGEILAATHFQSLSTDPAGQARFRSASAKHAGAWLDGAVYYRDSLMTHEEFCTAARLRLGLPHPEMQGRLVCLCGKPVEELGHHHLHRGTASEVIQTHNGMRDCLLSIFERAGFLLQKERLNQLLSTGAGFNNMKTDLVLTKGGRKILVDVTVRNPTASSVLIRAAGQDRWAATLGERQKASKYMASVPPGVRFLPASFECYGAWGTQITGFMASIMPAIVEGHSSHPKVQRLQNRLYLQISAAIAGGTAKNLLTKFANLQGPRSAPTAPAARQESTRRLLSDIRH